MIALRRLLRFVKMCIEHLAFVKCSKVVECCLVFHSFIICLKLEIITKVDYNRFRYIKLGHRNNVDC